MVYIPLKAGWIVWVYILPFKSLGKIPRRRRKTHLPPEVIRWSHQDLRPWFPRSMAGWALRSYVPRRFVVSFPRLPDAQWGPLDPKCPWTMKVLNPQYMGYKVTTPKNEGFGFPWYGLFTYIYLGSSFGGKCIGKYTMSHWKNLYS